jgi:hypothetical protein
MVMGFPLQWLMDTGNFNLHIHTQRTETPKKNNKGIFFYCIEEKKPENLLINNVAYGSA